MLNFENLVTLAKKTTQAAKNPTTTFSYNDVACTYSDLNNTLRDELNQIAGTYALYRENKNTLFKLIESVIDDALPQMVLDAYSQFAEIKQFNQGDKPVFVQKVTAASRRRAKQFITKVGLAGIYEVFKLDGQSYEVPTSAYGGAAQIGLEEFLDGRADWGVLTEIIMKQFTEKWLKHSLPQLHLFRLQTRQLRLDL